MARSFAHKQTILIVDLPIPLPLCPYSGSKMALPYDAIAPSPSGSQTRMNRMRAVGAAMAIAMVSCVALLSFGEMNGSLRSSTRACQSIS